MTRASYDSRFPVSASWALEFAPVNVSVVFMQPRGEDYLCIGSRSWFFDELANCIAIVRSGYPWKVAKHILPPEAPPRVWPTLFADLCIYNVEHAPALDDGQRIAITQSFLSRLTIDTTPRPWDEDSNQTLLDSLNGYRMKELSSGADLFSQNINATHEVYLARAVEHFAAYEWKKPARHRWGPAPDYSKHDRAVIAGGIRP